MSVAKVGDIYQFNYEKEPKFNCELKVVKIYGIDPEDFVMFDDGTHSKQKHLIDLKKIKR